MAATPAVIRASTSGLALLVALGAVLVAPSLVAGGVSALVVEDGAVGVVGVVGELPPRAKSTKSATLAKAAAPPMTKGRGLSLY